MLLTFSARRAHDGCQGFQSLGSGLRFLTLPARRADGLHGESSVSLLPGEVVEVLSQRAGHQARPPSGRVIGSSKRPGTEVPGNARAPSGRRAPLENQVSHSSRPNRRPRRCFGLVSNACATSPGPGMFSGQEPINDLCRTTRACARCSDLTPPIPVQNETYARAARCSPPGRDVARLLHR